MFSLLQLQKEEEYFLSAAMRPGRGVFFCRLIGYDDERMIFLRRLQLAAGEKGAYINKPLGNPAKSQVGSFTGAVDLGGFGTGEAYLQKAVDAWLPSVAQPRRALLAAALREMLSQLAASGSNPGMLKNMFVKWMCWIEGALINAVRHLGEDELPKVLYEGIISKHEVYLLRVLSRAGCDVAYVHFLSDEAYLKADPGGRYSQLVAAAGRGAPEAHFSSIDLTVMEQSRKLKEQAAAAAERLVTNEWITGGSVLDWVLKSNRDRGALGGRYYNISGRYLGIDERDAYLSRLYRLKESLSRNGRCLVMEDREIQNPSFDEVQAVGPVTYTGREEMVAKLAQGINVRGKAELTALARGAFAGMLEARAGSLSKCYNDGVRMLCWLRRYLDRFTDGWSTEYLPVFLYYGSCNRNEAEFLCLLSAMPVDVLFISPDKGAGEVFHTLGRMDRGREELLPDSSEPIPFPRKEPKVRSSTAAYEASRELDTALYGDSGLFRTRQFTRCSPVTLKTTYDEIEILWPVEAKFRPGFDAGNGRVVVPNLFARVCGVPDGDTAAYLKTVERLITDKTIFIRSLPRITPQAGNPIRGSVHKFYRDGHILPDAIKGHKQYPYDYLSGDTQDYILEKIQQVIELKWISCDTGGVEYIILSTLLNLDKDTLRLIQQFDFTRDIPKVVVVHVDESQPSVEDCIYLAFLNLAGFDIVVFTPTGYRNVDKYLNRQVFEEYQVGGYQFHLQVPELRRRSIPDQNSAPRGGNIFGRLFGKG